MEPTVETYVPSRIYARAGWFGLPDARGKILKGQAPFLDELHREIWEALKDEVMKGYAQTGGG